LHRLADTIDNVESPGSRQSDQGATGHDDRSSIFGLELAWVQRLLGQIRHIVGVALLGSKAVDVRQMGQGHPILAAALQAPFGEGRFNQSCFSLPCVRWRPPCGQNDLNPDAELIVVLAEVLLQMTEGRNGIGWVQLLGERLEATVSGVGQRNRIRSEVSGLSQ
jgi:hypothetical protein